MLTRHSAPPAGRMLLFSWTRAAKKSSLHPNPQKALQVGISHSPVCKSSILEVCRCGRSPRPQHQLCDPKLSHGLAGGNSKCFQHLWAWAVHISSYLGNFGWTRKQNIKEKIILESPFLDLANASRDSRNIQVQSKRKAWKFYFKGLYYPHLEQINYNLFN